MEEYPAAGDILPGPQGLRVAAMRRLGPQPAFLIFRPALLKIAQRQQGNGTVSLGVDIVRVDLAGKIQASQRLVMPAQHHIKVGQVDMGGGKQRPQPKRLPERCFRFIKEPCFGVSQPEIAVQAMFIRIAKERSPEINNSLAATANIHKGVAEVAEGLDHPQAEK